MEIKVGEFTIEFYVGYGYEVFDSNNNTVHTKDLNGFEDWTERYASGTMSHYRNSEGIEHWFNHEGNVITEDEYMKLWYVKS